MIAERPSWSHRLQTHLRREFAFLPKRLVVVALFLFVLYLLLLFRTEYSTLYTRLGFVEASLKSKLLADYDGVARPAMPFAPLRLEIIKAKIQDENPYLSEKEVAALVQASIAAAAAPIIQATATPRSHVPATVNAAVVINTDLMLETQAAIGAAAMFNAQSSPGPATPSMTIALGTGAYTINLSPTPVLDNLNGYHHTPQPLPLVALGQTRPGLAPPGTAVALALNAEPAQGSAIVPTQPGLSPGLEIATPLPTNALPVIGAPIEPIATVTHLAASQPGQNNTPIVTLTPTALTAILLATSIPSATPTPWPTATPLPTWTVTPLPVTPLPTVTRNPTVAGVQLSSTATALTLPVATATATIPAPLTAVPTIGSLLTPMSTALPTALVTQPPTPTRPSTLPPTLTATATTVIPPTLTPTLTALPLIDHLTAYVQGDKVYLEWPTAINAGIIGYNLYRQDIANGSGERINTIPIQSASYIDTVALDGRQYLYRVTIIDQLAQESLPSQAVTVTVEDRLPPLIPGNILVQLTGEHVQLIWDANTESDFIGYNIYRGAQAPVSRSQGPLNGATLVARPVYSDTILANGQTYYYSLTAVDAAGNESGTSREVQVATRNELAPAPPTGLTASFEDDDDDDDDEDNEDEINLKWQANQETDVIGYRLYRSTTLPVDTTVAPLHKKPLLTTLRYQDEDLARDTTYYYVVVAVDQEQQVSLPSAPVAVVVPK